MLQAGARVTAGVAAPRLGQSDGWGGGVEITTGTGISKQRLPRRSEAPAQLPDYAAVPDEDEGTLLEVEDAPQYAEVILGAVRSQVVCSRSHCPECTKSYQSSAGLYQHKRTHHPWLINTQSRVAEGEEELRFVCPEAGCVKAYTTSMGLYQHKRAKHPWLIKQRERGYNRPGYNVKPERLAIM